MDACGTPDDGLAEKGASFQTKANFFWLIVIFDTAGEVSTGYAAGASVMRRAHGVMRVFARGVSRNHSLSRSTFRPTAVRIWPRCTRGSPMERVRRRRVLRVPREMGPSIPARRAYSA